MRESEPPSTFVPQGGTMADRCVGCWEKTFGMASCQAGSLSHLDSCAKCWIEAPYVYYNEGFYGLVAEKFNRSCCREADLCLRC